MHPTYQWWRLETWPRSRDLFFEVSVSKVLGLVSVSKDFGLGLELFVSRLCIGYFLRSFARSSLKNAFKNDCSKFCRSKRSVAKLSLLLYCLLEKTICPLPRLKFILNSIKNVHAPMNPQRVISATRGWEYFAKDYLWTVFPRVLLWNPQAYSKEVGECQNVSFLRSQIKPCLFFEVLFKALS